MGPERQRQPSIVALLLLLRPSIQARILAKKTGEERNGEERAGKKEMEKGKEKEVRKSPRIAWSFPEERKKREE